MVFTLFGLFFLLPLCAMVRFSLEGKKPGTWSVTAWTQIVSYPGLLSAIEITLELAVITCAVVLVLLVPTMIWIRLRVQGISRTFEFLCLLPLTIPAIAWWSGWPRSTTRSSTTASPRCSCSGSTSSWRCPTPTGHWPPGWTRSTSTTMSEAARSLGANWFTVMWRVIVPNMRAGILNALLLTAALVLGEFTLA